ncbi:glycoprotein [Tsukamurella sp. 8F]|uniref:glycoprotein n=1 Tax=unclassified Tsukamurella TaxID=2633480 RepID=UPI0023B8C989|nr:MULTISPECIES: glycoprotein [unclassified Tsukamurella]MDF0529421.1 glycoprotein [Tsukamurella sp. 8J]MDF0587072.1 glycoprotein [Tsukamurella sp. 8F]
MRRGASLLCVLSCLVALIAWAAPAALAGMPTAQFVRIAIDEMTPRTVTSTSSNTVIVTGTLTNFGDRDVSDLQVRMQRAPVVTQSSQIRSTLVADNNTYDTVGRFQRISKVLHPGQSTSFAVSMPLRSDATTTGPTLGIDRPGVFPLLVNVNGKPAYGGVARLDDARTMLSVLSLPPQAGEDDEPVPSAPDSMDHAVTTSPARLTMLWPLADNPKLAAGVPGGGDTPVRLVDDALAGSLGKGGRLYGLLDEYDQATRGNDPGAQALRTGSCLAIDPDLLVTVQTMTGDYLVSRDPADARGPTRPGSGSAAASAWLARLRTVAARSCTVALPFGQADLEALKQVGDTDLYRSALDTPADVVDSLLGVKSQRGIAVPSSGALAAGGADVLRAAQTSSAVLAATSVQPHRSADGSVGTGIVGIGQGLAAATFDPNITTALAAMGSGTDEAGVRPASTGTTPASYRFPLTEESQASRRFAAVGAVLQPGLDPTQRTAPRGGAPVTTEPDPIGTTIDGRTELIVPPQIWAASASDARAVLSAATTLLTSGLAMPRSFQDLAQNVQNAAKSPPMGTTLRRPPGIANGTVPAAVVNSARTYLARLDQLSGSLVDVPKSPLTVVRYTSPLREDAIRALRFSPNRAAADGDAYIRLSAAQASLDAQIGSVNILAPGGTYTLASNKAPLLLVARNDLPLPIRTRVRWAAPDGVEIDSRQTQELPPRGTRQLELPTTVNFSRQIAVDLSLHTTTGIDLGKPIRVSVHSNAYGKVLFLITCGAGALLVLLAGRRLWHRFRGRPDRADEDRPPADEHARRMANSYSAHTRPDRPPNDRHEES